MEGVIKNFRRGRTTQKTTHMIVYFSDKGDREKAAKLVGKGVVWKSPAGREINGKVAGAHGNKGAVRVIFDKGMPGQSIGTKVEVM
ncbi:MAG: 50S ribosomal protein L35ae [Candidatus Omnitrophica bacterium]|nr:50S ribosomal protein L35ae [Candidatus Omnitrophota bacterium]